MTIFWRVDCTSDMDKQLMLDTKTLAWPNVLTLSEREKFAKKMSEGDALVWGRWLGGIGRIDGIGLITAIDGAKISVDWNRVEAKMVPFEPQGKQYWEKRPIFKFDEVPAGRYGLPDMLN